MKRLIAVFFLLFCTPLFAQNHSGGLGVVLNSENKVIYASPRGKRLGFKKGDQLTHINGKSFECQDAIKEVFDEPDKDHTIYVSNEDGQKVHKIKREYNDPDGDVSVIEKLLKMMACGEQVNLVVMATRVHSAFPPNHEWTMSMFGNIENDYGRSMIAVFGNYPNFRLVERTDLWELIGELHLQQTGAIKAETAKKIGEMTGANYALFCEFSRFPTNNGFNDIHRQKLVNLETGEILALAFDKYDHNGRRVKR